MSFNRLNSFQVICQKPQGDSATKMTSRDLLADNLVKPFFTFAESRLGNHLPCKRLGYPVTHILPFSTPTPMPPIVLLLGASPNPFYLGAKYLNRIGNGLDASCLSKGEEQVGPAGGSQTSGGADGREAEPSHGLQAESV